MAERRGFEPREPLRIQQISNLPLSATQAPLLILEKLGQLIQTIVSVTSCIDGRGRGIRTPDTFV